MRGEEQGGKEGNTNRDVRKERNNVATVIAAATTTRRLSAIGSPCSVRARIRSRAQDLMTAVVSRYVFVPLCHVPCTVRHTRPSLREHLDFAGPTEERGTLIFSMITLR